MQKFAVFFIGLVLSTSALAQAPVSAREVAISTLSIAGVSHLSSADVLAVSIEVKTLCCRRNQEEEVRQRILYAFQERGYFKAKLEKLEITPVHQDPGQQTINVSAKVSEGQQYRLKEIGFAGNTAFPSDQLRRQFAIANGDIVNIEKIRKGLDDLRKLYASQAYLNFTPVPNTDVNDATATISLMIDVDEGKQFHFGRLVLEGEEPQAGTGAKLIEAWKPYEGKIYDPQLVERYWQQARLLLPAGLTMEKTLATMQDGQSGIVVPRLELPEVK